jgi:hypothetical protein
MSTSSSCAAAGHLSRGAPGGGGDDDEGQEGASSTDEDGSGEESRDEVNGYMAPLAESVMAWQPPVAKRGLAAPGSPCLPQGLPQGLSRADLVKERAAVAKALAMQRFAVKHSPAPRAASAAAESVAASEAFAAGQGGVWASASVERGATSKLPLEATAGEWVASTVDPLRQGGLSPATGRHHGHALSSSASPLAASAAHHSAHHTAAAAAAFASAVDAAVAEHRAMVVASEATAAALRSRVMELEADNSERVLAFQPE